MAKATTDNTDIWSVKEDVFLPVISGEEPYLYVSLNNYSAQIPRGQMVSIPKPVADMLRERDMIIMQNIDYSRREAAKANRAITPEGETIKL